MTYVFNISDQYKSDDRWFMLEISCKIKGPEAWCTPLIEVNQA